MTNIDVTIEYQNISEGSEGRFIIEQGYDQELHQDELEIAKWIYKRFGGNITLLTEMNAIYMGKSADYLWNNKLWELKTTHSAKSVDSLVRKALQQIHDNPGGIIIKLEKCKDSIDRVKSAIDERIRKSCRFELDVMIIKNGELKKVIRYKK